MDGFIYVQVWQSVLILYLLLHKDEINKQASRLKQCITKSVVPELIPTLSNILSKLYINAIIFFKCYSSCDLVSFIIGIHL